MRDPEKLNWQVPTAEWSSFREFVQSENGSLRGYLCREVEAAMESYATIDGLERVEDLVDRLVSASGRTPERGPKEKKCGLDTSETTRVRVRVDPALKDTFREVARDSDSSFGVELGRALRYHREGGRAGRLERKLERVVPDAEAIMSSLAEIETDEEGTDDESPASLTKVERNTISIATAIEDDQFTDDTLEETIREVAGVDSEPSIRNYREKVTEYMDVEPHPNTPYLWLPSETVAEQFPGVPRVCRQDVSRLTREERVRRLRLELARRAADRSTGEVRVQTDAVHEEVFAGVLSRSATRALMKSAARMDGITYDASTTPATVSIDLSDLGPSDPTLLKRAIRYRDEAEAGLLSGPTTTMADYGVQADATFDALSAATDGGDRPKRGNSR